MKRLIPIAAVTVISSTTVALANANTHSGASSSASGAQHSSSAPAPSGVAPRAGPMPHYGNALPYYGRPTSYRPITTYHDGNRTLNYPGVRLSSVHHSMQSSASNFNNPRVTQPNAGNLRHAAAVNFNSKSKLDPQTSARLRNWTGNRSTAAQAHQINANNHLHHHDHDWWRHHCVTIIFWDWGWWGWWDGWWYPAWGYDPYSYYDYNEPIYGYGDLSPEQVIASVQVALQQQGYYQYAIDGQMGPITRAAIGRYQTDHRLPITYGIDPATLGSLGIIR